MRGRPGRRPRPERLILAIDTATSRAVLALGTLDGELLAADAWVAGHRHAEELLPRLDALLAGVGLGRHDLNRLGGVAVGLGPGAFTGLRVGIATAKALARATGRPLIGLATSEALLAAAAAADPPGANGDLVLLVPAGLADRTLVVGSRATLVPGETEPGLPAGAALVAVDLAGRAPGDALARGEHALDGLPGALVRLAAARLAVADTDDPGELVPVYVTVPRGLAGPPGEDRPGGVTWSPALR